MLASMTAADLPDLALLALLATRVRRLCTERGLTYAKLAEEADCSLKTIDRIVGGKERVRTSTLEAVARVLGTSGRALMRPPDIDDITPDAPPAEAAIEGTSPWHREVVLRLKRAITGRTCVHRLSADAPDSAYAEVLELAPLLLDWPRQVLESPLWSSIDTPLPTIPQLPLERVWIDLHIYRSSARPARGVELPELLDRRADTHFAVAESPEFVRDRLGAGAVVFGRPGSGKTSFLKWMMRSMLLAPDGRYLLPLFVRLRDYSRARRERPGLDLLDYALADVCGILDARQRKLWVDALAALAGTHRDSVLLLLDGWDELERDEQRALSQVLAVRHQTFGMIVTSRHTVPPIHLSHESHFEIAELSPSASDELISRWFTALGRAWQAGEVRLLLARQQHLARLTRNPFTLTLLCAIAYQTHEHTAFDRLSTRTMVYEQAIELIVRHHERERATGDLPLDSSRLGELAALALWLYADAVGGPRFVFDADDVERVTRDADLLPRALGPSRLVYAADGHPGNYQFVHATYHEYFVARALRPLAEHTVELSLYPHLYDSSWLGVILFLVGSRRDSLALRGVLDGLLAHVDRFGHVYLRAAQVLAESGITDGGRALLGFDLRDALWAGIVRGIERNVFRDAHALLDVEDLVDRTIAAGATRDPKQAAAMSRLLRELPSSRAVDKLMEDLISTDEVRASLAAYGGARVFTTTDLIKLRTGAADPTLPVQWRIRMINLLGNLQDLGALDTLTPLAGDTPLIMAAISAIGRIGGERAAAALCALLDAGNEHRETLYTALGATRSVRGRDRLLDALEQLAQEPDHPEVSKLLAALLEIPLATQAAVACLGHHLMRSANPENRALAASVLASASSPEVGALLFRAAREDPDPCVRISALESLVEHPNPLEFAWLRDVARDTRLDEEERARALSALLACASRFGGTRDWARLTTDSLIELEQALASGCDALRLAAIARADAAGPRAVPLLIIVLSDDDEVVQEEACRTLARIGDHDAALALRRVAALAITVARDESEMVFDPAARVGAEAARTLADCQPLLLLDLDTEPAAQALEQFAIRTGSLVFRDHILDAHGRRLVPRDDLTRR